jgi:glyoxylase-like metal-dependent hydrolase (beta-lactamase superfamily II)
MPLTNPLHIGPGIHAVAGPDLTDGRDALAYLIQDGEELALVDSGAGPSYQAIVDNIRRLGLDPANLKYVIATHAHIDHIGALGNFARDYSPLIVAHADDAAAIENADPNYTAASWYGLTPLPIKITTKLVGTASALLLGDTELNWIHTPGHTPGSISLYLDRQEKRYLFGQDIHGPFHPSFQSDLQAWKNSMHKLLALKADVLGEGHYGIISGNGPIEEFILGFIKQFAHYN